MSSCSGVVCLVVGVGGGMSRWVLAGVRSSLEIDRLRSLSVWGVLDSSGVFVAISLLFVVCLLSLAVGGLRGLRLVFGVFLMVLFVIV